MGPGKSGGAVTQLDNDYAPLFKRAASRYVSHVGLCPTRYLPFAGDVDAQRASDCSRAVGDQRKGVDRMDVSPRDRQIKHVRYIHYKWKQSESLPITTWRRMECPISIERTVIIIEWTASQSSSRSSQMDGWLWIFLMIADRVNLDRPPHLKLNPTAEKARRRTPRSRSDRTAIAARSRSFRRGIVST